MKVIAAKGLKVPKEGAPHDYITDATAVDVEQSAYYLRQIADGDLTVVEDAPAAEPVPAKADTDAATANKSTTRKGS